MGLSLNFAVFKNVGRVKLNIRKGYRTAATLGLWCYRHKFLYLGRENITDTLNLYLIEVHGNTGKAS